MTQKSYKIDIPNRGDLEVVVHGFKTREIQLGIPANTGKAQMEQIQRAIDYGRLNNVDIKITRIGK